LPRSATSRRAAPPQHPGRQPARREKTITALKSRIFAENVSAAAVRETTEAIAAANPHVDPEEARAGHDPHRPGLAPRVGASQALAADLETTRDAVAAGDAAPGGRAAALDEASSEWNAEPAEFKKLFG
jgi:hypothetical protein